MKKGERIIKNVVFQVVANDFGNIHANIYKTDKKGVRECIGQYKVAELENVDIKVFIPERCRTEYAQVIKINS